MNLEKHIELGIKHLDVKRRRARYCPICKSLNFSIDNILIDWIFKPPRIYDISQEQQTFVISEIKKRYKVSGNVCSLEIHHISYEMEITMPLCVECHKKVHNSNEEPWCKYKPIDKRPKNTKDLGKKVIKPLG